jgi:hypothetical protein
LTGQRKALVVGRNSMSLSLPYRDFSVCLYDDSQFDPESADNPITYDHAYWDQLHSDYFLVSRHGIRVLENDQTIKTAIVMAAGGATHIHERSALVDGSNLVVCCSDTVFCLSLPLLTLSWSTKADQATCFGIYQFQDTYIIHGELEITRLDRQGIVQWKFSGSDILITPNDREVIQIIGSKATVKNWEGTTYLLDLESGASSATHL